MLAKKAKRCSAVSKRGTQCGGYALSKEGAAKMLDEGFDLVADPVGRLCSFHARTEAERFEFQSRGGAWSSKRAKAEEPPPEKDPIPKEIAAKAQQLIVTLLDAKLPTIPPETDVREAALGVYLACAVYAKPEDHARLLWELLPRDVRARTDINDLAETELRATIEELEPDEQKRVWEMLAA